MAKSLITKKAVMEVLRLYWNEYKIRPWSSLVAFIVPAIGTIFVFYIPPLMVSKIINIFSTQGIQPLSSVWIYIALFASSWLFGEVCWRIGMHYLISLEAAGTNSLNKYAFKKLVVRDYDFYSNNFVGTVTSKAASFGRGLENFTDALGFNILNNLIPLVFAFILLWHYAPIIPVVLITGILVAGAISIPIIRRRSAFVVARQDAGSTLVGKLSDVITNILAVKSYAAEKMEYKRYEVSVEDFGAKFRAASNYQNLRYDTIMSPMYVAGNTIGLILSIYFAYTYSLPIGTIVIVFSYYGQITRILFDFNRIYRNLETSISSAAEFTQLLLEPPKIEDIPNAKKLEISNGGISFENVGFGYNKHSDTSAKFLNDFDLEIKANQKVGLVGPSGGGKTTITKLLLRFIDVQSGAISIDGQNISKVTQNSLRKAISYVPQEPLLFHRSLFENIAYGKEDVSKEEVIEAAKLARAHDFIIALPHGYDTLVGERGIKLSGGQRQRVAIARAILKNSQILILDEATSSLDSESEKYIQEGLKELMKDKTALVIAHRLSTIKHLDRIIVLEDGKIVQDGTHNELLAKKGLYARLWSHQSGEFLEE